MHHTDSAIAGYIIANKGIDLGNGFFEIYGGIVWVVGSSLIIRKFSFHLEAILKEITGYD